MVVDDAGCVVAGTAGGVALGVTRDPGHEGVPVVAVGSVENDATLRSRYFMSASCGVPRFGEERVMAEPNAVGVRIGHKSVLFAADDDSVSLSASDPLPGLVEALRIAVSHARRRLRPTVHGRIDLTSAATKGRARSQ